MMRVPGMARMTWTPALRIAAGCVALTLVADVALLARAIRKRDEVQPTPLRIAVAPLIAARRPDVEATIDSARDLSPFEPLGTAESPASSTAIVPQAMPLPITRPRLIGTVVGGAESFVVMALADGAIKVVRLGERAGDLKLRAVSAGGAVFDDIHGDRVTLRSPTPGSEPQP
ncbi:MAG: hypothetical protein ABI141_00595 [Gemmatimonadaceae bacterium]